MHGSPWLSLACISHWREERYVYSESGQMLADRKIQDSGIRGGTLTEYLLVDAVPVAVSRVNGLSYIESDHLGTPRVAANPATNAKEWDWDLLGKAFGENAAATFVSGKDVSLRYPGQWLDVESGLHYNYFRDYEPRIGRYIESDPIGLKGGVSTYAYVRGQPLLLTEKLGLMDDNADPMMAEMGRQRGCAQRQLRKSYQDMRDANFIGADK